MASNCILNLDTHIVRDVSLINHLGKKLYELTGITSHVDVLGSRSEGIDQPRLALRDGNATADHALGLTRIDGTGNATDVDVSWQVVHSNEGSHSPVGTRAEENGTSLATHGEARSTCPDSLKKSLMNECTECTEEDCEGRYRWKRLGRREEKGGGGRGRRGRREEKEDVCEGLNRRPGVLGFHIGIEIH